MLCEPLAADMVGLLECAAKAAGGFAVELKEGAHLDVANVVATAIAAFAGGVGAFWWERRKRKDDEMAARGSALLRTGAALFGVYTLAAAIRKQFCEVVVDEPHLMIFMKPILVVDKPPVQFDVGSLGFMLGTDDEELIARLLDQEEYARTLRTLISERARIHGESVVPLVPKHTRADGIVDDRALLAEIGQGPAYAMESLSTETIKLVEKQLARLPEAQGRIQELLEKEFEGRNLKHMLVPPYVPIRPHYDARKTMNEL